MNKRFLTGAIAAGAAAALALTGCTSGDAPDSKGTIEVGLFNWDEAIAVSHLWKHVLEDEGYEVNLNEADPGAVFLGVAEGDYDVTFDVWLPLTHRSYLEEFGDRITELGAWNDEAKLTIAVNEDAPIDSLDELADKADLFGDRLVGIEPGAGLTEATTEAVIPAYGLEGLEYTTSSTPAMLAELQAATEAGENVAVTLWRPHWAYDAFPIKDLEDPEGTLGDAESLYSYGSATFAEDFPEVAAWLQAFTMDSELLHSLENEMFNENTDPSKYEEIVAEWAAENQEYVASLTA
ncbi:glycine betaine ABC transporter substrate-binding protein [Leucobacter sp.]